MIGSRWSGHGPPLAGLALLAAGLVAPGAACAQEQPAGYVSALRGKPQVLADGRLAPMALMQTLPAGAMVVLRAREGFAFCHEGASKTFRVEGAGAVHVGQGGIDADGDGPRIAPMGACAPPASPSETGGVLLRSVRPPASPK
ncbi:hypothetical protein GCM10007036_21940 [Alsobacter metallidurans]|uniref:Uncharacterized protein n=1 Tax=Alsobacter metallidurans TaxID=340221 RepID=A0A917MI62_9HYPH|nr:hypothetical protein [Alsobacter metallidurans]GGH19223.1 hypothetical protein GCM10007036_21940 [Alsobacter metallidurans]